MKLTNLTFRQQQEDLCQSLEEQLQLFYTFRTTVRTASHKNPRSLQQVLNAWIKIHQQQHQLKTLLKPLLHETQCPAKPGRAKKTA